MSNLPNNVLTQKQENFAQLIFSGTKQCDAYIQVYHPTTTRRGTIDCNASIIRHSKKIIHRLNELTAAATSPLIADKQERMEILSEVARGKLSNFIECGQDGSWINIDREKMNTSALQSIATRTIYNEDSAGPAVVTKIKLHDPVKAIGELNRMDGSYAPEKKVVAMLNFTPELIAAAQERLKLAQASTEAILGEYNIINPDE